MVTAMTVEPAVKLPRPSRWGFQAHGLSEEEARVRAISEIVNSMADLNTLKSSGCRKYGLSRVPKLVEMIAAVPESDRESLLPNFRANSLRQCCGGCDVETTSVASYSDVWEYLCVLHSILHTGYESTSMRAIRARCNPYVQARSRIDQLKRLGHSVAKVELAATLISLPADYRDYCFIRNL